VAYLRTFILCVDRASREQTVKCTTLSVPRSVPFGDKLFLDTKRYYVASGVQYREKVTLNSSSHVNTLSCTVDSVPVHIFVSIKVELKG
jgi:hypothetical protein